MSDIKDWRVSATLILMCVLLLLGIYLTYLEHKIASEILCVCLGMSLTYGLLVVDWKIQKNKTSYDKG